MSKNQFHLRIQLNEVQTETAHLFQTDSEQRLVNCNAKQVATFQQISPGKNLKKEDLLGLTLHELYASDFQKADKLANQNEEVMRTGIAQTFKTTLVIPGLKKINILTTKVSNYSPNNKLSGIFGVGQFISEFSLQKAAEYQLTRREVDCLEQLLYGKTSKKIAETLGISIRTVDDYIDHLKGKLDCENRLDLIAKATKLGFLRRFV